MLLKIDRVGILFICGIRTRALVLPIVLFAFNLRAHSNILYKAYRCVRPCDWVVGGCTRQMFRIVLYGRLRRVIYS